MKQHDKGMANKSATQFAQIALNTCKPIDGSQYHEVIEEQEYSERRPTPEEQRPRFAYQKVKEQDNTH